MLNLLLIQILVWRLVSQGAAQLSGSNGTASESDVCPTWFVPVGANSTTCTCGNDVHKKVHCNEDTHKVGVLVGVCMTYWSDMNTTVVGKCPYNQYNRGSGPAPYHKVSNKTSELNGSMCASLNREGLLCGKCKTGFQPTVNSVHGDMCIKCTGNAKNWVIFLSVTLLPTTIFFLVVMIFRINANAPPLSAFVLLSQLTCSFDLTLAYKSLSVDKALAVPTDILYTIYRVWNLDFFRPVIPPYCLPGVKNSMQELAIEYLVAFYPLVLVLLAYLCIRMYNYNIRPVVVIWRPFHRLFVRAKRSWDPNASVINTFATFLLLSYWKLTYVSFQLLAPTDVFDSSGTKFKTQHFYYDASQKLFHGDHLPLAILAIMIIATFVVLPPIILCLYPTRLFRKFLWCIRIRGHGIVAFMDVFQGSYKDGTNGTRDWRFMSGAYFLLRIVLVAAYVDRSSATVISSQGWLITGLFLVGSALAVCILKPYKQDAHTITDSLMLATIALHIFVLLAGASQLLLFGSIPTSILVLYIASLLAPLLYAGVFIYFLVKRKCFMKRKNKDILPQDVSWRRSIIN